MIEIEFDDPEKNICECCGNESTRLTRFVYQDNNAFAVYYAKFTEKHDDKVLYGLIGLGEWCDDEKGEESRTAFAFKIWLDGDQYQVGITDAEESPWGQTTLLGNILNREDAIKHEWIKDVFHITDHMVEDDQEIVNYFGD
jgi:hypothetical protein